MHWALVLFLTIVTCGFFGIIWGFVQYGYINKLGNTGAALPLMIIALFFSPGLFLLMLAAGAADAAGGLNFISGGLWIGAYFSMANPMRYYFNQVENIGLRLSGAMIFFFGMLYFQHHLTRIAEWRETGRIVPQY